jgi:hypothetical protein
MLPNVVMMIQERHRQLSKTTKKVVCLPLFVDVNNGLSGG